MNITEIDKIMIKLSEKRSIFHSEADFQFALAWQIKEHFGEKVEIRLEQRFSNLKPSEKGKRKNVEIDLLVEINEIRTAIELKHFTKENVTKHPYKGEDEELFDHKMHAGHSWGRISFIDDVSRIELLKRRGYCDEGFAILMTNDENFKKEPEDFPNNFTFKELKISKEIDNREYKRYYTGKNIKRNPLPIKIENGPYKVSEWTDYGIYGFFYLIAEIK